MNPKPPWGADDATITLVRPNRKCPMMPTEMVDVLPKAVSNGSGEASVGDSPEIAAAREALEQQWNRQNSEVLAHDGVTPAPAASQAWSLGSVGAVWGSVVKVAAQAITFSRQAIVKGLACIGISFDQAANTHASDAANDSAAKHSIDWNSAAANRDIYNHLARAIKERGL